MKKIVTLAMLALTTLTASAQETTYRKSWDFTKWSATTVANLKAEAAKCEINHIDGDAKTQLVDDHGALWSDHEKAVGKDNTSYANSKDGKCFWSTANNSEGGDALSANNEVIAELQGLYFTASYAKNRSLAIGVDYNSSGSYHGASYLWFGASKKDIAIIRGVPAGTTIKMGVESHKVAEARGVELYLVKDVNTLTHGTKLKAPDGNEVAVPTTYQDLEWLLPAEDALTDADKEMANEDGTYNVLIYNTNGCHVYYITVGEGDEPAVEEAKKVAYLYSGNAEEEMDYMMLSGDNRFNITPIDVATKPTLETLKDYQVVVVATSVTDAAVVKPLIAFIPVVNLNPNLYEGWGYGKAIAGATATQLTIVDAKNAIFEGLDQTIDYADAISVVELANYFADDDVLAKAGDNVAIHTHNPGRNAYYYIPVDGMTEAVYSNLLPQTVLAAAKTQRDVAAVGTPNITFTQEDGKSIVTITAANSKAIYYTLDGTDPTITSTLYTEPFEVTENKTVKAFATGDGFTDSEIGSKDVTIATKLAKPTITVAREAGKSTVTIAAADGATIYYNFKGNAVVTESKAYTEPIVLTQPTAIYAFATAEGYLNSDAASQFVGVNGIDSKNIRWDIVGHFDANAEEWSGKGQQTDDNSNIINPNYFFTWGKNAGQYWDETSAVQGKTKDGTADSTWYTKTLDPAIYVSGDWKIVSIGQVMVWEKLNVGFNIGDGSMRNPDTAEDAIGVNDSIGITENALTFGKQPSGGPFNASLESTKTFKAPFDVVIYAGNGNDNEIPTMQVETSADGKTWTKLGDVAYSTTKRIWKKTFLSYEGTDEVYVRILHTAAKSSGQIYDLYVMKNGEESAKYDEKALEDQYSGISETRMQTVKNAGIYNLRGVRMRGMQRGLNIVVGADGSVRKVMVK